MVDDPRSGESGGRESNSDHPTDRIPTGSGRAWGPPPPPNDPGYDDLPTFDDDELGPLDDGVASGAPRVSLTGDVIVDRDASDLVRRYLFPTEKYRGEWRRHPIHL